MTTLRSFNVDERGAMTAEYGLICIAVIGGGKLLGSSLNGAYANVSAQMK